MSNTTQKTAVGQFCWVDLGSSDIDASKKFYGELFHYDFHDSPMPNGVYSMMMKEGNVVGAIYQRGPEQTHPMSWLTYINVDSCDDSLKKAQELGGTQLMPPHDVPGAGRMAIVSDPTGAMFAFWQPHGQPGYTDSKGKPGGVAWNELMTKDPEAAATFYCALFGWTSKVEQMGPMTMQVLSQDDTMLTDFMKLPDSMAGVPSHWLVYFAVSNLDSERERAVALGAKVIMPRVDIPFGSLAVLIDPQGASFALWEGKAG